MMEPIYKMDDTQWAELLHDVEGEFNDLTIKRGFQYYKQGRVRKLTMQDSRVIEAIVEGSENYRVKIRLDALADSNCSCPVSWNCKHMLAALLDYANRQERPVHALVNAKSNAMLQQTAKNALHAASLAAKQARELAEFKERAGSLNSLPLPEWHKLFEHCLAPMANHTPNAHYVQGALRAMNSIKPQLSPGMEQLFRLHTYLYILEKLVKHSQHTWNHSSHVYMGYHTQVAADDVEEAIERCLAEELAAAPDPEHGQRLTETLAYLRTHMLTEAQNLHYYFGLYYRLWQGWLRTDGSNYVLYTEELQQLKAAEGTLQTASARLQCTLAQVWMHFYLGQDREALERLRKATVIPAMKRNPIYPLLDMLIEAEQWERLRDWLTAIGPLLRSGDELDEYGRYWEMTTRHHPESEPDMWETLDRMSPYSRGIYADALLTYGKWEQWIDYQLSTGSEPLEFRVSVLQPIEKEAPELLLPFYHQAVERYIAQKNRDSYKAAVKLLKRLAKLYKRMKQEARWEHFLSSFTGRHSRLRALHEELRRGKLIS
ncbi:SWIM zinc finger family protein [Paenibacillus spongiae]|uniref:SWIM zinc finger family protein n=1 Tax=Paenibacillus spongiae TaxID=2909671 RepID=A0ABY5SAZ5_9BACL|nr:SWIM zinc finger family protein [Paenibacillus spongiae]UVI30683.1 SWIM zinc finger family protein [Paenibacillus spongiae]